LSENLTGLDIGKKLSERQKPFVFLTANEDLVTLKRATRLKPKAYISKPFKNIDIQAALEIIFANQKTKIKIQGQCGIKKMSPDDIMFVKTDRNYLEIRTEYGVFRHRSALVDFMKLLPDSFIQVNRFCVVNTERINERTASQLKINDTIISISLYLEISKSAMLIF